MMAKQSPTSRTLQHLRKIGFTAAVVERWNQYAHIRQDLFSFIDIIAMRPGIGIVAIQATSGTNHAARREKILGEPKAAEWIRSGGRIEIWSWALRGKAGKRKLYDLRREEIELQTMIDAAQNEVVPRVLGQD